MSFPSTDNEVLLYCIVDCLSAHLKSWSRPEPISVFGYFSVSTGDPKQGSIMSPTDRTETKNRLTAVFSHKLRSSSSSFKTDI